MRTTATAAITILLLCSLISSLKAQAQDGFIVSVTPAEADIWTGLVEDCGENIDEISAVNHLWLGRAYMYSTKNDLAQAMLQLEWARKKDPDNPRVRVALYHAYKRSGMDEKAEEELKKARSLDKSITSEEVLDYENGIIVPFAKMQVLADKLDYANSEDAAKKIGKMKRLLAIGTGYYYLRNNLAEKTKAHFEKLIEEDANNAHAYVGLAYYYDHMSDRPNMEKQIEKALTIDPQRFAGESEVYREVYPLVAKYGDMLAPEVSFMKKTETGYVEMEEDETVDAGEDDLYVKFIDDTGLAEVKLYVDVVPRSTVRPAGHSGIFRMSAPWSDETTRGKRMLLELNATDMGGKQVTIKQNVRVK